MDPAANLTISSEQVTRIQERFQVGQEVLFLRSLAVL